jgi:thioredoxin 1
MVFREQIILFAEAGALPPQALEAVIQQARALDMAEVRKNLAAEPRQA